MYLYTCLALCVGCIVCVFKMDGYIDNMDKEREEGGDGRYLCSSLLPRMEYLSLLQGSTPF